MKKISPYIFCILLLLSCAKDNQTDTPGTGEPISWKATSVDGYATKALVNSRSQMEMSCTPKDKEYSLDGTNVKGLGQTVGIWASYRVRIDNDMQEFENIFNGTHLIYNPESAATDSKWEYLANPAYWVIGGEYVFRAYYPAGELNVQTRLSTAKSLVVEMNTFQTQRDMLLAYNSYDTGTGLDAHGNKKNLTDPVELNFHHGMSALRFIFKFYDGDDGVLYSDDALTSCWLASDTDEAFATTGFMIYGNGTDYTEGLVQWSKQYSPAAKTEMYKWENTKGISFSNRRPTTGEFSRETDQTTATAYSDSLTTGGEVIFHGKEFTRHNGWLVIIPQKSNGQVRLNFTTARGGNTVFSVLIPEVTGTSEEKYRAAMSARSQNDDPSAPVDATDEAGCDFVPGYRYTYTISISKTDATIGLSIAPWNRLDSSFDIKFQ